LRGGVLLTLAHAERQPRGRTGEQAHQAGEHGDQLGAHDVDRMAA